MAILFSLLLVTASFIAFAAISYLLVRSAFPKIENDDWEERYIQMRNEASRLAEARKKALYFKEEEILS